MISTRTDRAFYSTVSRKNFSSVKTFIEEPDSRGQCVALEDNVKEFGLTYFGLSDRRQGMRCCAVHVFGLGVLTNETNPE